MRRHLLALNQKVEVAYKFDHVEKRSGKFLYSYVTFRNHCCLFPLFHLFDRLKSQDLGSTRSLFPKKLKVYDEFVALVSTCPACHPRSRDF